MKEDDPIVALRRKNLRNVIDDAKKNGVVSSDAAFAEKYEIKGGASFLSQLTKGHGSFGDKVARRIEEEVHLAKWFLDTDHDLGASKTLTNETNTLNTNGSVYLAPVEFVTSYEKKNTTVRIPVHKDVKASCGDGVANFLEGVTSYLEIDPNLLKMLGIKSKPDNLRIIYSSDYSMWPTVAPDSPLFVDITEIDTSTIINGDVYVFLHNNFLRMKRVFIGYGDETSVRLQSDNPDKKKYPDEIITKHQLNELRFVGRLESALVKP